MNYIEEKYVYLFSSQLEGFKKVGKNCNFRCPVCGDSEKDKRKKRGWILGSKDRAVFYCHNCGTSMSFQNLLKQFNPVLHKEYVIELMKERGTFKERKELPEPVKMKAPVFDTPTTNEFLLHCTPLSELHRKHPAVEYMLGRKLPEKKLSRLYWIDDMREMKSFDKMKKYNWNNAVEEGRIVFPFFSPDGLVGVSCRSIDPENPKRYVIYKFDESKQAVFGLYDPNGKPLINAKETVYVTEGAVDSLFLKNAVAVNGSDLPKISKGFKTIGIKAVFVPDNEPRNKQIVGVYEKIINNEDVLCIFPTSVTEKDVNEMVLEYGQEYVQELIEENTYSGLKAKLQLTKWRKC